MLFQRKKIWKLKKSLKQNKDISSIKKNVIVASQLYDVADVQFKGDWVESRPLVPRLVIFH